MQLDFRPGCVREHNVDGGVFLRRRRCVPNPVVVCVAGDDPGGAWRAFETRRSSWVDGESAEGSGRYAYLGLSEDGADVVRKKFQCFCEVRSRGIDGQVLLLDEVDPEDGLVPGQSPEHIHGSSDLSALEVQITIESSDDLDWVSAC